MEQAEADEHRERIEAAYRRHYRTLVQICRERTSDPSRAEDLAQEALVRALRYRHTLDPSLPVLPWLRTIATRVVYDDAARASSQRETVIDLTGTDELVEEDFADTLVGDHAALRAAFRTLSTRHQTALRLRYLEDWSSHDTARFLGVSRAACDQMVSRAKRRLRAQLERVGENYPALAPFGVGGFFSRVRLAVAQRRAGITGYDATLSSLGAVAENLAVALALTIAGVTLPGVAAAAEFGFALAPSSGVDEATAVTTSEPVGSSPASTDAVRSGVPAAVESGAGDDGASVRSYRLRPTEGVGVAQAPPTAAGAELAKDEAYATLHVQSTIGALGYEIDAVDYEAGIPCTGPKVAAGTVCRAVETADGALPGGPEEGEPSDVGATAG